MFPTSQQTKPNVQKDNSEYSVHASKGFFEVLPWTPASPVPAVPVNNPLLNASLPATFDETDAQIQSQDYYLKRSYAVDMDNYMRDRPECKYSDFTARKNGEIELTGNAKIVQMFSLIQEGVNAIQTERSMYPTAPPRYLVNYLLPDSAALESIHHDNFFDDTYHDIKTIMYNLTEEKNIGMYDNRLEKTEHVTDLMSALTSEDMNAHEIDRYRCYRNLQTLHRNLAWTWSDWYAGEIADEQLMHFLHNREIEKKVDDILKPLQQSGLVQFGKVPVTTELYTYIPILMSETTDNFFVRVHTPRFQAFYGVIEQLIDTGFYYIHNSTSQTLDYETLLSVLSVENDMEDASNTTHDDKSVITNPAKKWVFLSTKVGEKMKKMIAEIVISMVVHYAQQNGYDIQSYRAKFRVSQLEDKLIKLMYIACLANHGSEKESIVHRFNESLNKDTASPLYERKLLTTQATGFFHALTGVFTDRDVLPKMPLVEMQKWTRQFIPEKIIMFTQPIDDRCIPMLRPRPPPTASCEVESYEPHHESHCIAYEVQQYDSEHAKNISDYKQMPQEQCKRPGWEISEYCADCNSLGIDSQDKQAIQHGTETGEAHHNNFGSAATLEQIARNKDSKEPPAIVRVIIDDKHEDFRNEIGREGRSPQNPANQPRSLCGFISNIISKVVKELLPDSPQWQVYCLIYSIYAMMLLPVMVPTYYILQIMQKTYTILKPLWPSVNFSRQFQSIIALLSTQDVVRLREERIAIMDDTAKTLQMTHTEILKQARAVLDTLEPNTVTEMIQQIHEEIYAEISSEAGHIITDTESELDDEILKEQIRRQLETELENPDDW